MHSPRSLLPVLRKFILGRELLTGWLIATLLIPAPSQAAPPSWWAPRGVLNDTASDDYAVLNQGQLKNLVRAVTEEMNALLPGGAGSALNARVNSWLSHVQAADDYALVSLKQLKLAAKPVYQRLVNAGVRSSMPTWVAAMESTEEEDQAVANIGQAKNLFLLSIPDWVKDTDGDGFTDHEEALAGKNPNNAASFPAVSPAFTDLPGGPVRQWPTFWDENLESEVNGICRILYGCTLQRSRRGHENLSYEEWEPWKQTRQRVILGPGGFIEPVEADQTSVSFLSFQGIQDSNFYPDITPTTGGNGVKTSSRYYAEGVDLVRETETKGYSRTDFYLKPRINYSNPLNIRTCSMIKLFIQLPEVGENAFPGSSGVLQYVVVPSDSNYTNTQPRVAFPTLIGDPPPGRSASNLNIGETVKIGYYWQEIPINTPSFSLSDSTGPRYRKIGLNGFPLADAKPQQQSESGLLPEETYIDAYNRQLRHAVSDVYVSTDSTMLPLQVRRNVSPESWSRRFGPTIEERMDRPFGPGWTSNLSPVIRFESSSDQAHRTEEDFTEAVVTDEQGAQRTFFNVPGVDGAWISSREQTQDAKSLFDTLVKTVDGHMELRQKFGTVCRYQIITENNGWIKTHSRATDNKTWKGGYRYNAYARLVEVRDRLGNRLLYEYQDGSTHSLIPHVIYDPDRPSHRLSIQQNNGLIVKIQGADGEMIHYGYENVAAPGVEPLPTSFQVLKNVRRSGPGQSAPAEGGVSYQYDTVADHDPTPDPENGIQTEFIHLELSKLTDERGKVYQFSYRLPNNESCFDRGWEYAQRTGNGVENRKQVGLPRLLCKITLPDLKEVTLTGDRGARVSLFGAVTNASCTTTISGDCGTYEYKFSQPYTYQPYVYINQLLEFLGQRRSVSFTKLELFHGPSSVSTTKKETFEFATSAGLALSKTTDRDEKVTQFTYSDPAVLKSPVTDIIFPSGIYYDDPVTEKNALGGVKKFAYDKATRVLKSITDELGIKTAYTLKAPATGGLPTGLRTKETVTDTRTKPATVLRVTDYQYNHPRFKGFITKQIVQPTATGLPTGLDAPIGAMTTSFAPDSNGRVRTASVELSENENLVTRYAYTHSGMKKTVTDPRNLTTSFEYEPDTLRLKKATQPDGSVKRMFYDAHGNLEHEINEIGVSAFHEYDDFNRKIKTVLDLNGNGIKDARYTPYQPATESEPAAYNGDIVTEASYNAYNLPASETDARGTVTRHEYDTLGRRTQTTVNYGASNPDLIHITSYADDLPATEDFVGGSVFDVSGFKPKKVTDSRGFVTSFIYDDLYREKEKTLTDTSYAENHPARSVNTKTYYDAVGNPVIQEDALGRRTVTSFDGLRRPWQVIHPVAPNAQPAFTQTSYTPGGQVWKSRDEMGAITRHFYDNAGRQIKTVLPAILNQATGTQVSPQVFQSYDENGNVIQVTDSLGNITKTAYDNRNRPWKVRHPAVTDAATGLVKQPEIITSYDALGRTVGVTDPLGNFTETRYDRAGRVLQVIAPPTGEQTHITSSSYDPAGNALTVTNAGNQTVTNTYDAHNRLTATVDAEEIENHFSYDKAGNRTEVIDGRSQETLFTYDAQNRLLTQKFANNDLWTYDYNDINKISQTDAKGVLTEYGYDIRNRLQTVTAPDLLRIYAYDKAGRLLSVTEPRTPSASVVSAYNALGWLQTETSQGVQHTYGYDLAGNRVHAAYGTGRTVTTVYDALKRPKTITENGRTTSYGYDLAGRALVLVTGNGQATQNVYDELGRLTARTLYASVTDRTESGILAGFRWWHDAVGNVTIHSEQWNANASRPAGLRLTTMTYDDVNRLEQEVITHTAGEVTTPETATTYTYDNANNRATKTVTGGPQPGYWSYSYNEANQLATWTQYDHVGGTLQKSADVDYDLNGNRTGLQLVDQTPAATYASLSNQGITYRARSAGSGGENLSVSLVAGETLSSTVENSDHLVVTLASAAATSDTLVNQGITYTKKPALGTTPVSVSLVADHAGQSESVDVSGNDIKVFLETDAGDKASVSDQGLTYTAVTAGPAGNDLGIRLEKAAVAETPGASVQDGDIVVRLDTEEGEPDTLESQGITYTTTRPRESGDEVSVRMVADQPGQEADVQVSGNDITVLLETDNGTKAAGENQGVTYTATHSGTAGNDLRVILGLGSLNDPLSAVLASNNKDVQVTLATTATQATGSLKGMNYQAVTPGSGGNSIQVSHVANAPNQTLNVSVTGQHITITLPTDAGDKAQATLFASPTVSSGITLKANTAGPGGNDIQIEVQAAYHPTNPVNRNLDVSIDPGNSKHIIVKSATDASRNPTSTLAQIVTAIQGAVSGLVTVTGGDTTVPTTDVIINLSGGGSNPKVTSKITDVWGLEGGILETPDAKALIRPLDGRSSHTIVSDGSGTVTLAGGGTLISASTGAEVQALLNGTSSISAKVLVDRGHDGILEPGTIELSDGGKNPLVVSTVSQVLELLEDHENDLEDLITFAPSEDPPPSEEPPMQPFPVTLLSGGGGSAIVSTLQDVADLLNEEMDELVTVTLTGDPDAIAQPGVFQMSGGGHGFAVLSGASDVVSLLSANALVSATGSGTGPLASLPKTTLSKAAPVITSDASDVVALLSGHPLFEVTGSGSIPLTLLDRNHLNGVTSTTLNTFYTWNTQDRLTGVTLPDGTRHDYQYDYRVRRLQTSRSGGTQAAQTTSIVFAGGLSLAEYESSTPGSFTANAPTVHYLRGPDMGGGVGGMLYSIRGSTLKYSLSNGRGDIVAQSDENAAITWTASYEAFGKRPAETGTNLDKQRANSKDEDPTGLLNEGFRYRDLETGAFISRDPAGFVDGPNLYAYVKQNPWTKFDPHGLAPAGSAPIADSSSWDGYRLDSFKAYMNGGDSDQALSVGMSGGWLPGYGPRPGNSGGMIMDNGYGGFTDSRTQTSQEAALAVAIQEGNGRKGNPFAIPNASPGRTQLHPRASTPHVSAPKSPGKIKIEDGARPNADELRVGEFLSQQGYGVTHLKTSEIPNVRTPDLWMSGYGKVDVITTKLFDSKGLSRYIEKKNTQTNGVFIQGDGVTPELMQETARRVWGKPSAENIRRLMFEHEGELSIIERPSAKRTK